MASNYTTPVAVASAGVASHLFFFKQGERHLYPLRYLQTFVLGFIITVVAKSHYGNTPTKDAVAFATKYASFYLAGLYSSLIIYRLFFNPLNRFPGPYWARLSGFYLTFRVAGKSNLNEHLTALHKQYGKIVRVDPNGLSVTHPDGVEVVSGNSSKCIKAPWYSLDDPAVSMHTSRDRAQHDRRRRIWSPAFSDKALRGYEQRVQKFNDLLLTKLSSSKGGPINVSLWFNLYSFDVMGDLAFGFDYKMLEKGVMPEEFTLLSEDMEMIGLTLPIWIGRLLFAIPGLASTHHRFVNYCSSQLANRIKVQGKSDYPDITHALIEDFNTRDERTKKAQLPMLQGDSRLIIVAGSDTTAATLTHLFYHIAAQKGLLERLREELDELLKGDKKIEHQKLKDAPLLNGSINEVLRLHPPVPSGVYRKTPKQGVEIGGIYVPGETTLQMPGYAMARDADIYPRPEEFIPERFSTRPDLLPRKDAFAPFSIGPYGCIGKNLAYMEIRLLTSQIIQRFDVRLADGEKGDDLMMKTKDHFTLGLGDLKLCFTEREI